MIIDIKIEQGEYTTTHKLYVDGVNISDCCDKVDFSVSAASMPTVTVRLNGKFNFSGKAKVEYDADKILLLMSEKI